MTIGGIFSLGNVHVRTLPHHIPRPTRSQGDRGTRYPPIGVEMEWRAIRETDGSLRFSTDKEVIRGWIAEEEAAGKQMAPHRTGMSIGRFGTLWANEHGEPYLSTYYALPEGHCAARLGGFISFTCTKDPLIARHHKHELGPRFASQYRDLMESGQIDDLLSGLAKADTVPLVDRAAELVESWKPIMLEEAKRQEHYDFNLVDGKRMIVVVDGERQYLIPEVTLYP